MPLSENIILWRNLERIKDQLLLDDSEFAQFLDIPYQEYLRNKNKQLFLPLTCMFEFSEKLNLHFEDLLSSEFKLNSTITNNNRDMILADRYSIASYSKTKPILNIINYLEIHRGVRAKINLLRKFQLTEEFILNQENNTNIFLISDIAKYLTNLYNFTPDDFLEMGKRTPFLPENKVINELLKNIPSVNDSYSFMVEGCYDKYDKNFSYRILSNKNNQILLEASPKKIVLEELKVNPEEFGNESACYSRMGIISSISYVNFGIFAPIKKIKSLYSGDDTNLYSIDTSSIRKSSDSLGFFEGANPTYH